MVTLNIIRITLRFFSLTSLLFPRFNDDNGIDNNSANSRDALLEEAKPIVKRRYSNASQSSHEFSDGEKAGKKKRQDKSKNTEDPLNTGSIVGIDWLFESGECAVEPWTSKSKFDVAENLPFFCLG